MSKKKTPMTAFIRTALDEADNFVLREKGMGVFMPFYRDWYSPARGREDGHCRVCLSGVWLVMTVAGFAGGGVETASPTKVDPETRKMMETLNSIRTGKMYDALCHFHGFRGEASWWAVFDIKTSTSWSAVIRTSKFKTWHVFEDSLAALREMLPVILEAEKGYLKEAVL